ncbi:nuclear transport factor 2 family protein [Okeania sp.]|uniref:nuclear transport factor 2 family protein n=1 Tax=Okeania sp. TaxID=3100323 RepID=UPI002B4B4854|nr:nuclear transport factor 2 family protein [Okeania sp.]MEB3340849.1 nuclear transport factor 2 family protein [Okeania sp.]
MYKLQMNIFQMQSKFSMKFKQFSTTLSSSLLLSLTVFVGVVFSSNLTLAKTPEQAPKKLTELLQEIDRAASGQNLENVINFYSNDFTNSDGLNRESLAKALANFWRLYKSVKYQTKVQSWENDGNTIVAETITYITGVQKIKNRDFTLKSTITSKQRYENGKIVEQEILAEENQITTGEKPPNVNINLPAEVKPGEKYNFDAVVQEPLGEEIILGAALVEPINENSYNFEPTDFTLELLSSGGLFKIGEAPENSEDKWLSAVLMRKGGISISTYRLRVIDVGK